MATSYIQAANPIWYVADLVGRPAGGGMLFSYSATNPNIPKPIYQDSGGINAFPNPILFSNNGQTELPFYFADDVPYYLVMQDFQGNQIWAMNSFSPSGGGGGGGGGGTTIVQSVQNYVANNAHLHANTALASPVPAGSVLAPGNHAGFSTPDTTLVKSSNVATDAITFPPLPDNVAFAGDVKSSTYLLYNCTVPAVETFKWIRYPIQHGVKSLQNTPVYVTFWACGFGGTQTLNVQIRMYMGQGGAPSADITIPVVVQSLTLNKWQRYAFPANIPVIPSPTVLGSCGDDAVFLEFGLPLNATSRIGLTKASLYLGTVAPMLSFDDNDQVGAIIDSPRTGQTQDTFQLAAPLGWLALGDGTIGPAGSGATARANLDTWQLYSLLWGNPNCPLVGASTGTAVGDFNSNAVTLTLPPTAGRVGAAVDGGHALGLAAGANTHAISIAEMPSHNHPGMYIPGGDGAGGNFEDIRTGGGIGTIHVQTINGDQGGGTPMSLLQATSFRNVNIKL